MDSVLHTRYKHTTFLLNTCWIHKCLIHRACGSWCFFSSAPQTFLEDADLLERFAAAAAALLREKNETVRKLC